MFSCKDLDEFVLQTRGGETVLWGSSTRLKFEDYQLRAKGARIQMVNTFNSGPIPIFLISLKAGGAGLNLTGNLGNLASLSREELLEIIG